jgi:hypothetical protein
LQLLLGAQSASLAHGIVLHALPAQAYGEHDVCAPAMQTPLPSQVEGAARFCLPLHIWGPQTVPAAAGVQVPAEPGTAHEKQSAQLAAPQHTPSTQWPLRHCGSVEHAVPFGCRLVQAPPTHEEPSTQSPSPPQVVRQAPFPHRNGLQLTVGCAQAPAPLQKPVGVDVEPMHEACPHDVAVGAYWQLPAPLQAPVRPHGGAATQRPCGSGWASGTSLHAPARPETSQAWQVPHAELAQQTPSTQ